MRKQPWMALWVIGVSAVSIAAPPTVDINEILKQKFAAYKDYKVEDYNTAIGASMQEAMDRLVPAGASNEERQAILGQLRKDIVQSNEAEYQACVRVSEDPKKNPDQTADKEGERQPSSSIQQSTSNSSSSADNTSSGSKPSTQNPHPEFTEKQLSEYCSKEGQDMAKNAINASSESIMKSFPKEEAAGTKDPGGSPGTTPTPSIPTENAKPAPVGSIAGGGVFSSSTTIAGGVPQKIDMVLEPDAALDMRHPEVAGPILTAGHGGVNAAVPTMPGAVDAAIPESLASPAARVESLQSALDERVSRREITPDQAQQVMDKVKPYLENGASLDSAITQAMGSAQDTKSLTTVDGATPAQGAGLALYSAGMGVPVRDVASEDPSRGGIPLKLSKDIAGTQDPDKVSGTSLAAGASGAGSGSALQAATSLFSEKGAVDQKGALQSNNPSWFSRMTAKAGKWAQEALTLLAIDTLSGSALRGTASQDGDMPEAVDFPSFDDEAGVALAAIGNEPSALGSSGATLGLVFFGGVFATTFAGIAAWRRWRQRRSTRA
ncbi:hypothetical protein K2X33_05630 [bacterium]|nr:hypothetical protein [bacterium]